MFGARARAPVLEIAMFESTTGVCALFEVALSEATASDSKVFEVSAVFAVALFEATASDSVESEVSAVFEVELFEATACVSVVFDEPF